MVGIFEGFRALSTRAERMEVASELTLIACRYTEPLWKPVEWLMSIMERITASVL